jgi:hypothetical protein
MFAANGNRMAVGGIGKAGPFSRVLFLQDLQVNLFSQKQARQDGGTISLSADASIFTVIIPGPPRGVFVFVFDGTFWIYEDAAPASPQFLLIKKNKKWRCFFKTELLRHFIHWIAILKAMHII